jgi:hypothetical protein
MLKLVYSGRPYNTGSLYSSWPYGVLKALLYFVAIWYIFPVWFIVTKTHLATLAERLMTLMPLRNSAK